VDVCDGGDKLDEDALNLRRFEGAEVEGIVGIFHQTAQK
jgi:hypothetical protein